jgi:hypothetical protein
MHAKNNNIKWKLKSSKMFMLAEKKDNKHTILFLVWDKKIDQNPKPNPNLLLLFFDFN